MKPDIQLVQEKPIFKLKLPNFGPEEQDKPLFYLKKLNIYIKINEVKDDEDMSVISQI